MGELGGTQTVHNAERERLQDQKAAKLEQIGQLCLILKEEGIECKEADGLTAESSLQEIDSVQKLLFLKNDRNRCASMAEEFLIGAAEWLGTVFDGTKEIPFLGWKPDYRNFHHTLAVKLGRLRFETATLVGRAVERGNLSPLARVFFELAPSLIFYPRQRAAQNAAEGGGEEGGGTQDALRAIRAAELRALEGLG
jgi:hypothetical protein